jgi:hypothetical protein
MTVPIAQAEHFDEDNKPNRSLLVIDMDIPAPILSGV